MPRLAKTKNGEHASCNCSMLLWVAVGTLICTAAEAICELMSRPGMQFAPIKNEEQQAVLMLHKTRDLMTKQRTMCVNALRAHLSEFGVVVAKGISRINELLALARPDATHPEASKVVVQVLTLQLEVLQRSIDELESEIVAGHGQNEMSRLLEQVPGVGKITSSIIAASVPNPAVLTGRDLAAWVGLTARQNSSGGKQTFGGITKQGNR